MFDKFGEMNSYLEINELAENLVNEGDLEGLKEMAVENGLAEEFVEMYTNGDIQALCDAQMAALGKIEMECNELSLKEIMQDWAEYIKTQCMENDLIAHQARKKGKSMKGCIAKLLTWSFANQTPIGADILKEANISAERVTMGIPGMGRAKRIIKEYYMSEG